MTFQKEQFKYFRRLHKKLKSSMQRYIQYLKASFRQIEKPNDVNRA